MTWEIMIKEAWLKATEHVEKFIDIMKREDALKAPRLGKSDRHRLAAAQRSSKQDGPISRQQRRAAERKGLK